jgi:hypothetical protein
MSSNCWTFASLAAPSSLMSHIVVVCSPPMMLLMLRRLRCGHDARCPGRQRRSEGTGGDTRSFGAPLGSAPAPSATGAAFGPPRSLITSTRSRSTDPTTWARASRPAPPATSSVAPRYASASPRKRGRLGAAFKPMTLGPSTSTGGCSRGVRYGAIGPDDLI